MSDKPLLFPTDALVTAALDKLVEERPSALPHVNYRTGAYWHPILGFRGQAAVAIQHLTQLAAANRLSTASGQDLIDYVRSEFLVSPDLDEKTAVGTAYLARTSSTTSGTIPAGTRLARSANPTTQIPLLAASYETEVAIPVAIGQTVVGPIPIRATTAGPGPNHPLRTDTVPNGVTVISSLFDTFTVTSFQAGGGANKPSDDFIKKYALASAIGQYGPTADASRFAALEATGVRNVLVFDPPGAGYQKILVADESWAGSDRWAKSVQQQIYDSDMVGVGCRIVVETVQNKVVSGTCTVRLRDQNFVTETTGIDQAIQKAMRAYLDERADWNVYKNRGLRAAITSCHPKILHCHDVTLNDTTGAPVAEITTPDLTATQYHLYLASNAVKITYQGPV